MAQWPSLMDNIGFTKDKDVWKSYNQFDSTYTLHLNKKNSSARKNVMPSIECTNKTNTMLIEFSCCNKLFLLQDFNT